jgi:hypothetical protein
VAAGLIAVREKFHPEVRIEKFFVIIRAMDLCMAEGAVHFGSEATVTGAMTRWDLVTSEAVAIARLVGGGRVAMTFHILHLD